MLFNPVITRDSRVDGDQHAARQFPDEAEV